MGLRDACVSQRENEEIKNKKKGVIKYKFHVEKYDEKIKTQKSLRSMYLLEWNIRCGKMSVINNLTVSCDALQIINK